MIRHLFLAAPLALTLLSTHAALQIPNAAFLRSIGGAYLRRAPRVHRTCPPPMPCLASRFLAIGFLVAGCSSAFACEPNLVGTWKSDAPTTMAFFRENARLEPKAEDFLQALFGHMTLTFAKNDLHTVMPDIKVPVAGKLRPFAGSEERKPYKILFCNSDTVVYLAKEAFGERDEATTFHFVGPDTFWVYLGSNRPGVPDLNGREYFQRVH